MRCYICGKNNAYVEYKRGKGKVNIKKALVGAVVTAPMGSVGLAAGFSDLIAQKGYCVCPDCGYNQFASYLPGNILNPSDMSQLNVFFEDYGISYVNFAEKINNYAKENSVPVTLRFAEVAADSLNGPETVPCIIIEHPSHTRDYFGYCIVPENANFSGDARLSVWLCGKSAQLSKADYNMNTQVDNTANHALAGLGLLRGGSYGIGYAVGALGSGIARSAGVGAKKFYNSLTLDKSALNQETCWYDQVENVINYVFS